LAIKSLGDDGSFYGYASVFDVVDTYNEIVAPGAFRKTLAAWKGKGQSPAMLWMHDTTQPIGLWFSLSEDKKGLAVSGQLALRTQRGAEAHELLKMGALTGLSIGYRVVASRSLGKGRARVLTELELFEISLVTFPANESARVSVVKTTPKERARAQDDVLARAVVARLHEAARVLQGNNTRGCI
jgi:HK97 family phage prohead protease